MKEFISLILATITPTVEDTNEDQTAGCSMRAQQIISHFGNLCLLLILTFSVLPRVPLNSIPLSKLVRVRLSLPDLELHFKLVMLL